MDQSMERLFAALQLWAIGVDAAQQVICDAESGFVFACQRQGPHARGATGVGGSKSSWIKFSISCTSPDEKKARTPPPPGAGTEYLDFGPHVRMGHRYACLLDGGLGCQRASPIGVDTASVVRQDQSFAIRFPFSDISLVALLQSTTCRSPLTRVRLPSRRFPSPTAGDCSEMPLCWSSKYSWAAVKSTSINCRAVPRVYD